ncbi:unnamed protein product, partial [Callosobruchus maculatus]
QGSVRHLGKSHERLTESKIDDKEEITQKYALITTVPSETADRSNMMYTSKDEDFTTSSEIVPIDLLEAKDSLIRHEISLLKKREQWRVEPKDSLEVQKDSQAELLQKKSSKLSSAKNSVELMRESKQKLRELTPYPLKICKGERDKNDKRYE